MSGPFSLRYLHLFVGEQSAGAFILSRNGRSADFVGESADDVAAAIRQRAGRAGYRYFWYVRASSAKEAVQLAHAWQHRYRPTDNSSSPSPSHGLDWHCTAEGCAACALALARH